MKKILKLSVCIALSMGCVSITYANSQTLKTTEQRIHQKYAAQDFYQINQKLEKDVVGLIQKENASFNYGFPLMTKNLGLSVKYSPDRLIKSYTFDVGGGGTMGTFSSYVQFKSASKYQLQAIEAGFIQSLQQVKLQQKSVYLIQSYYKGDSCHGMYQIQAFTKQSNKFQPISVFQTKTKKLDSITVEYNCSYDPEREGNYIRVSKDMRFVDIRLLDSKSKPTTQYLRYQLTPQAYVYQGTVK